MKKITYLHLRALVLERLFSERCFGQKQMLAENVAKFARDEKKAVETVIHKLIAQGLVLGKKKHYGIHVWLNTERLDEIREILLEKSG
ncbi:MAG: hypothetical protein NTY90_04640 [Candidatus Micrarchaeota archaeon]|nr:hypothetical protein [Candidatus Micrarchaeota archaeon]